MLIFKITLVLALLDLIQRWLGDVDVTALDQLRHLTIEEGQQQGSNMCSVHVRIRHDDDAVITQLFSAIFLFSNARA